MIDLYGWPTPNGSNITVMLEETALQAIMCAWVVRCTDRFA
ncbi:MAG TPA: hypothetical protein VMW17_10130 [Candidatus Binatia bacterium]|nr:hypothetical protein [Candidatus Binatia bacterium]